MEIGSSRELTVICRSANEANNEGDSFKRKPVVVFRPSVPNLVDAALRWLGNEYKGFNLEAR
jgi:hypothetical protein